MNHDSIGDQDLVAYAMGEQCNGAGSRVAAHIANCDACTATVKRWGVIRQVFTTDDSIAPSPETRARAYAMFRRTMRMVGGRWAVNSGQ
ncbi:MAG: hypothetical protein HZC40_00010 [Chloroflexi bacterium]|nr:hypothetical protein [Chloroflexota bacterium]